MHGRLLLIHHPDAGRRAAIAARLGGTWRSVDDADSTLATTEAPIRESVDGRAVGARTGVLFNLRDIAAALTERGVPRERLDGHGACVEAIAHRGPEGLAALRRHGVVAVLHRAQAGALVCSDALGLAPLYVAPLADGRGYVVASDRAVLSRALAPAGADTASPAPPAGTGAADAGRPPSARRVAPGEALMLTRGRVQALRLEPAPGAGPFLRERPAACVQANVDDAVHIVGAALREAVAAWQADRGPLADPAPGALTALLAAGPALPPTTARRSAPCPWPALALANLLEQAEEAGAPDTQGLTPGELPEPVTRVAPPRVAARVARYNRVRRELWEPPLNAAAAAGDPVGLPHWDPRVVATLGAMPHAVVRALGERFLRQP